MPAPDHCMTLLPYSKVWNFTCNIAADFNIIFSLFHILCITQKIFWTLKMLIPWCHFPVKHPCNNSTTALKTKPKLNCTVERKTLSNVAGPDSIGPPLLHPALVHRRVFSGFNRIPQCLWTCNFLCLECFGIFSSIPWATSLHLSNSSQTDDAFCWQLLFMMFAWVIGGLSGEYSRSPQWQYGSDLCPCFRWPPVPTMWEMCWGGNCWGTFTMCPAQAFSSRQDRV